MAKGVGNKIHDLSPLRSLDHIRIRSIVAENHYLSGFCLVVFAESVDRFIPVPNGQVLFAKKFPKTFYHDPWQHFIVLPF